MYSGNYPVTVDRWAQAEAVPFGFLLYQNMLWFVSDDAKLPNMVEQIREELYEGFSIQDFLLAFLII